MKAMLYADWMNLRHVWKSILWVAAVMLVVSFSWAGVSFLSFLVVMLSVLIPATLLSTDRAYGWDKLCLALPVSRRDIVSSKFTVGLAVNAASLLFAAVVSAGYDAVMGGVIGEDLMALVACEAAALVLMGLQMVCILRFGPEKGRYILFGCVWLPIVGAALLGRLPAAQGTVHAIKAGMRTLDAGAVTGIVLTALAVGAAVYVLCWRIGVRLYSRKEF